MLRSDNIQIRSQLSATQRRMLQEKQQVMDYLRQIENDLVEKEQIKQREAILRKDYEKLQVIHQQDRQTIEQLNGQINQDRQKLNQLEQERLQLLKTIENFDDKQAKLESQLDSYRTGTKRLYTHFKIPFDSIQSIDQLIPMLEDRYRTEQVAQVSRSFVQCLTFRIAVVLGSYSSSSSCSISTTSKQRTECGRTSSTSRGFSIEGSSIETTG